jgi:hypothetical protein
MPARSSGGKACNGRPDGSPLQATIGASEVGTSESPVLFEWKYLFFELRFPQGDKIRVIDCEYMDRGAANLPAATQLRSDPFEVVAPDVPAWMKETHHLAGLRIGSRDVGAFVPIAVQARQGEILENCLAPMLTRNDVVNVKGQRIY